MEIQPNTLFLWPKGQRLTPTQAVMLMLPGGLVQGSEEIGSIIEVPDEAEIGFDGQMPDKTFERILVKLAPGQAVRLHRATQAMMVQPSQPVTFGVEDQLQPIPVSFQLKSIRWSLKACNILDEPADVLICSANVSLNLSGGVGADLLGRYGLRMQAELHRVIAGRTPRAARQREVIAYSGPELPYKAVLHAVAVDGWYHATPKSVRETMATALRMAMELTAKKVTLTALATGFGDLTLPDFAAALRPLMSMDFPPIEEVCLCLMEDYRLAQLAESLSSGG